MTPGGVRGLIKRRLRKTAGVHERPAGAVILAAPVLVQGGPHPPLAGTRLH